MTRDGSPRRPDRPADLDSLRALRVDADLSVINRTDADGIIWVKEVEDYQRFGVVVTDSDGNTTKIVEKPKTPISKRANIGLYYIRNWKLLYEGIEHVLKSPKNQGEYFLTDAFQYMID